MTDRLSNARKSPCTTEPHKEPQKTELLRNHAVRRLRRDRSLRHITRRDHRIITWWVCAIVPQRCWRRSRRHANVGFGSDPERGHLPDYSPAKMRMMDVPKTPVKPPVLPSSSLEPAVAKASSMSPPWATACKGDRGHSNDEQQDHNQCPEAFTHRFSPFQEQTPYICSCLLTASQDIADAQEEIYHNRSSLGRGGSMPRPTVQTAPSFCLHQCGL